MTAIATSANRTEKPRKLTVEELDAWEASMIDYLCSEPNGDVLVEEIKRIAAAARRGLQK